MSSVNPSSCEDWVRKSEEMETALFGGRWEDSPFSLNSLEIESLARFAVDEHNKKENAFLELKEVGKAEEQEKVVKVQEQVFASKLHRLSMDVIEAGKKKRYVAKIWVKPWLNFKELHEFKHYGDFIVKEDHEVPELQMVLDCDPVLQVVNQYTAKEIVKTIQQRSNSLLPYELHEIVHARISDEKFEMLLKVNINGGEKQEIYKAVVWDHEDSYKWDEMEITLEPL